ncbi:hypothetical protein P9695_08855 [Weizmannia sp. CD-2023]|uniref:hypothetical protein n=1 Tax=Heyndrickxia TaxID=2837504 RepID=UPI002E24F0DE|nr:hypothetical protein [Weizmannia sp. CD-2023]MED4899730.1 hypothetical protein [Weizmannia sp. CD-2023]
MKELLTYLQVLAQLQASGHIVNGEIKEALTAVRQELGFEEVPKQVKDSKKLLFDNVVLNQNLHTDILFHAVVERNEKVLDLPFGIDNNKLVFEDVVELVRLFPNVHFVTKEFIFGVDRVHNFDKTFDFGQFGVGDVVILDSNIPLRGNSMARFICLK